MTITKETIGRLPLNVGDYDELIAAGRASFWRKNRVCRYGCEWESLMDGNAHAPATLVDGAVVADTEHWKLISGVPENYARPGAVIPVSVATFNTLAERVTALEQRIGGGGEPGGAEIPTVLVSEIDDLHDALLVRGGSSPMYAVRDVNNYRVGILMLVGDNAGHLVTQILYTHSLLDDETGVIDFDQHDDTLLTQAQRSYGLRSPFITNGEWTKWQRPNLDYFNNMNTKIESETLSLREDQPLTNLQRKNAKSNLGLTTASVEDIRSLWTAPKEEEQD